MIELLILALYVKVIHILISGHFHVKIKLCFDFAQPVLWKVASRQSRRAGYVLQYGPWYSKCGLKCRVSKNGIKVKFCRIWQIMNELINSYLWKKMKFKVKFHGIWQI